MVVTFHVLSLSCRRRSHGGLVMKVSVCPALHVHHGQIKSVTVRRPCSMRRWRDGPPPWVTDTGSESGHRTPCLSFSPKRRSN